MKKLVKTLSKKLLLLSVIIGASTLMASTASAANKVVDFGTITSQVFAKNQNATAFDPTIIITDDGVTPTITAVNDIRLIIPAGATNMVWDSTDTSITINNTGAIAKITAASGGACAGGAECTVTVTYTDSDKTMIIPVETNFVAADSIQIKTLTTTMKTFTAAFYDIGLGISTDGNSTEDANCGGTGVQACNTQTLTAGENIDVGAATIASAAASIYAKNQADTAVSAITVTDDATAPVINTTDNLRITIPTALAITWEEVTAGSNTSAVSITGTAKNSVNQTDGGIACAADPCIVTATLEDSDMTLVLDINTNLTVGQTIIINSQAANGRFSTFSVAAGGATDTLDLEVANDATVTAVAAQAIGVGAPTMVSSSAQTFYAGMASQSVNWTITLTEGATAAAFNTTDDIIIRIPTAFNMQWDSSDTTVVVSGTDWAKISQSEGGAVCAADNCSVTVTFAQADAETACTGAADSLCKVMRIPVQSNFAVADDITVTGALVYGFDSTSDADNLELEAAGTAFGSSATDEDSVTMTVLASTSSQAKDKIGPNAPTNFAATVNEDLNVVLTWTDPTDSDLSKIEIYKATGSNSITGSPITTVNKGIGKYIDNTVKEGETVKYMIRGVDSSNNIGTNSGEISVTIEASATAVAPVSVTLATQNASGQSGTATLTEANGKTTVTIATTGGPTDVNQPAHIHMGSCSALGDAKYTLTNVTNNASVTVLDMTIAALKAQLPLAINIHKSAEESGVSYSCGDILATAAEEEEVVVTPVTEEEAGEPMPIAPVSGEFPDTSNHWAKTEIAAMTVAGIIKGNPDGTFKPNNNINRAEVAILICRIAGNEGETTTNNPFSDVKAGAWYGGCVSALKTMGIIKGNPDGTYEPTSDINRAEFLTLAMRIYEELVGGVTAETTTTAYTDLKTAWYTGNVATATKLGFVNGSTCGTGKCFYAENPISRAEASTILYRMFKAYLEM